MKGPVQIMLDGDSLDCEQLLALSRHGSSIVLADVALDRVRESRLVVDQLLAKREVAYGINTGFGLFSDVVIDEGQLEKLQENLIKSHSAGVGEPLPYERTRMLLALRINVLCRGNSGVSERTLMQMVAAFNAGCISVVPAQGTVGASGDLAPLSHLALGLLGYGRMWDTTQLDASAKFNNLALVPEETALTSDVRPGPGVVAIQRSAAEVLADHGLEPIKLGAKEGLALINGTQMIASLGAEAVVRARNAQNCADVIAALTLEVLKGTVSAFHPRVHERRAHKGQGVVAARLRALLHPGTPSELFSSHNYSGKVQDAYSLRCTPQVHGIVADTISFVESVLDIELNSSTDNPMVFTGKPDVTTVDAQGNTIRVWPPQRNERRLTGTGSGQNLSTFDTDGPTEPETLDEAKAEIRRLRALVDGTGTSASAPNGPGPATTGDSLGAKRQSDTFYTNHGTQEGFVISGGNFHGEYPAKVLDYLAIGTSELASISERRIERLVNPALSGLPAFLVQDGGLNSGFMIAHCTAAALVSENKALSHPASVDSISTSAAKEDHVSMGGYAARKALQVVENVEHVLAIELLSSCQALEFHRPLRTTEPLEALFALVREHVPGWDRDRIMSPDINAAATLIRSGALWNALRPYFYGYEGTGVDEDY
ncbi:Phenylalanine ammonia-lyase [Hondaea fermentalgiana]|uniref:Phenylalanine ammonia-lyase n=1 Tax=Hondaea fermentalgiana TaxID=2315210 RepID=A0A2R5GEV5_9STRA|nr:Phenylalanine ammonia-lyase [Hondaea fermentalgiana]|eukprot:GBG26791.1 Phenylalanine ammonia-lyase [Hondaea fermentalgiana]